MSKMYGSYSDADLNDWEKFPLSANVLTSSAFGAWLMRRDERRDKCKLEQIRAEIKHFMYEINPNSSESDYACNYVLEIIDKATKEQNE